MSDTPSHSSEFNEDGSTSTPARQLSERWQRGESPDLDRFLGSTANLSDDELVDVLCVDQRERWRRGGRLLTEDYLKNHPALAGDPERVLDLIYNEYRLRCELGESPELEEYTRRFPDFAAQLRLQIGFGLALTSPSTRMVAEPNAENAFAATQPQAEMSERFPDLPGYKFKRVLGRGGMGVVFEAEQLGLKRAVAVKVLQIHGSFSAADRDRFRAEAQAIARLQHPNIVQIFETVEHGGQPFLVMELIDGVSLARKLGDGPMAPRQAAELARILALAIHYAHGRGVVHRDLKPANVMFTADGIPKIGDFGLARRLDTDAALTATGQILGTPSYMAPEQARGKSGQVGPATDVYALGATLYECLTACPPFKGATPYETILTVIHDHPSPPRRIRPAVSRDLDTICLKCLEKIPSRRYASALELADDLGRFLDGRPIAARPVGSIERLARWARRRPATTALLLLVAVVLSAAAGRWFWLERQQARHRDQVRAAIAAAIGDARTLGRERRWSDALAALTEAEAQLGDADSGDLQRQVDEQKADLRRFVEADQAALRLNQEITKGEGPPRSLLELRNVAFDMASDGERIVFAAADGDLYLLNLLISRVSRLTDTAIEESTPAFSPDGKSIVYVAGAPNGAKSVYVRSLENGRVKRLTTADETTDRGPAFSPQGDQIVFARAFRRQQLRGRQIFHDWDLCVINADGTGLKRISRQHYPAIDSPRFLPSGRDVIYSATVSIDASKTSTNLFRVDAAGGKPPEVLQQAPADGAHGAWAAQPAPLPDGRHIVFISDRKEPYHYDLVVMDLREAMAHPLGVTRVSAYNQNPIAAPDGKSILFLAAAEQNFWHRPIYSLWKVTIDGGKPTRIATDDLFVKPLSWRPEP